MQQSKEQKKIMKKFLNNIYLLNKFQEKVTFDSAYRLKQKISELVNFKSFESIKSLKYLQE